MRIARVFPRKTNMTPTDPDAYIGMPGLYTPEYDEIHISVTFTWDLPRAEILAENWDRFGRVRVGGPALNDKGGDFEPGRFLRPGVTITSRGCPNRCKFCFVPGREGKIRELPIRPGNTIQDNNLLACSDSHIQKVFQMLRSQRQVEFAGGLEASRVTDAIVDELSALKIRQIWLAFDRPSAETALVRAVEKLRRVFSRDKIRCYVLIGGEGDTIPAAESRLEKAWDIGTLPYAMRYQKATVTNKEKYLSTDPAWAKLKHIWSRPAITKKINKQRIRDGKIREKI